MMILEYLFVVKWRRLESHSDWFEIYELPNNVYPLYESDHFQEVISFLICGSQRSLLLDTALGIGDIKKEVDRLTANKSAAIVSRLYD